MVAESLPIAVIARIAAVLGGEELYQTKADKDSILKTYHFARNQLKEGHVNVRLKSEFPKKTSAIVNTLRTSLVPPFPYVRPYGPYGVCVLVVTLE